MLIRNVRHKGLKRFIETGGSAGLPAAFVEKIRTILTFLDAMASANELESLPIWKPHQLTGRGSGVWAFHVTKNWRITFVIDRNEISDLDFEDYHRGQDDRRVRQDERACASRQSRARDL